MPRSMSSFRMQFSCQSRSLLPSRLSAGSGPGTSGWLQDKKPWPAKWTLLHPKYWSSKTVPNLRLAKFYNQSCQISRFPSILDHMATLDHSHPGSSDMRWPANFKTSEAFLRRCSFFPQFHFDSFFKPLSDNRWVSKSISADHLHKATQIVKSWGCCRWYTTPPCTWPLIVQKSGCSSIMCRCSSTCVKLEPSKPALAWPWRICT